jgi:Ca2+-binding EF-hand superfamily protein
VRPGSWLPLAAVGLAGLAAGAAPEPPLPAATGASVREVVYFGGGAPVRMRFHISLAGRPVDEVWAEAVGKLFAFCDRNGDGALDAAERSALVAPRRTRASAVAVPDAGAAPLQLNFGRNVQTVTRDAFAAAVRAAGYGPVGLAYVAGRPDSSRLSAALFRHLDADGDGKLSFDELKMARARLAPLDANEDELLTADEILGRAARANVAPVVQANAAARSEESLSGSPDLAFLDSDIGQAVQQLLVARGGSRATALNRRQFGADEAAFKALDVDGNGLLDTTELAAWLRRPPDADLTLTYGPGRHTLSLANAGVAAKAFRSEPGGAVAGETTGALFRFDSPGDVDAEAAWKTAATQLRERFKQLTKGKDAVSRSDVESQPAVLALFDLADRTGHGRVGEAEVDAALGALAALVTCRVEIRFLDQGNGLFELLDRNGDGQLSPRELVEAPTVLRPFADATGRVGPENLKRRFVVRAAVGGIPAVVAPASGMPGAIASNKASSEGVPAWFTKMDRNGDGDVSLREFLGPLELFRKLDRDGDGLISPEEARLANLENSPKR